MDGSWYWDFGRSYLGGWKYSGVVGRNGNQSIVDAKLVEPFRIEGPDPPPLCPDPPRRTDRGTVPDPRVVEAGCVHPLQPGAVPASKSQNEILNHGNVDRIGKKKCPLTHLRGLFIENPFSGLTRRKSSFSPLYRADKIFTRSATDPGPLWP